MPLSELTQQAGQLLNEFSEFPNVRLGSGVTNRDKQIITWKLPNGAVVQMYINPQSLVINDTKQINAVRTKGGFVIQYWGENLTKITLQGTTGSSGIKGINVLENIYKAENRSFEIIAASQANELFKELDSGNFKEEELGQKLIPFVESQSKNNGFILRPSLASMAVGVTMFYQGAYYKGFFTDMTVTENTTSLGLFDYHISFTSTEKRGYRKNFMPWHREPLADDLGGQLLNALANKAGNAIRGFFGLSSQNSIPTVFHPESAPLTFGGNSVASQFDIDSSGPLDTITGQQKAR